MVQHFNAPELPGVYIMKDGQGKVIYVGKAKNLRKRLAYYFPPKPDLPDKTKRQVQEAHAVEFIVTDNEVEALILESNLIKKERPKYNVDLKDSFRYVYVIVTDEEYPRLITSRKLTGKERGKVFGPYVFGEPRAIAIRALRKMFQIRTCIKMPKRECLLYHLGQCSAPCVRKISKEDYKASVDSAVGVLSGDAGWVLSELEEKMRVAAKEKRFEEALRLRDDAESIRWISGQHQKMDVQRDFDQDVIGFASDKQSCCAQVFNIVRGVIRQRQSFRFDSSPDNTTAFLKGFYAYAPIPDEIVLRSVPEDSTAIEEFFARQRGKRPRITLPKRGDKEELLALVEKNAAIALDNAVPPSLAELKSALRLPLLPRIIECFDISNLGESFVVAGMSRFVDGKPDKDGYRQFRIRTVKGQNDFDCIKEAVRRRYLRLKTENAELPDLVMVDGGKGQLHSAMEALLELGETDLPVIGLAKKNEEIHLPTKSAAVRLDRKSAGLKLLQSIRDEAHRFANRYRKIVGKNETFGKVSEKESGGAE